MEKKPIRSLPQSLRKSGNRHGITLLNALIGGTIAALMMLGIYRFISRFQSASENLAKTTEAEARADETMKALKGLWLGRAQESVANCNCTGSGTNDNCPAVAGGPCPSHQLLTGTITGCQGIRIYRPVTGANHEFREYLTVCHPSKMPGVPGAAPAPLPACPAGQRPVVEYRSNVNGALSAPQYLPPLEGSDEVAASVCARPEGTSYAVDIQMVVRLSQNRPKVVVRKVMLTTKDRSANIEYLTK